MANATPRDARAGFDIFRSGGGEANLEDLNAKLYEAGYGPISQRTFRHYRNLTDAGFSRYVSINRFDVARSADPYGNRSAKPDYFYGASDQGVEVVFAKSNKLMETIGRATQVGEVGALLQFDEHEVVLGLRKLKPQPGDMVTVRYLELGRSLGGSVVEADVASDPAVVEIEYGRLITVASLGVGEPLPTSETRFVLTGPGQNENSLDLAGQRLYHFFEVIEGVRSVANRAASQQQSPAYAPPPELLRLSIASPAEVALEIAGLVPHLLPPTIVLAVLKLAWELPAKRKEWLEGDGQREVNKVVKVDKELKELALEKKRQEAAFEAEMLDRLRLALPDSRLSDAELRRWINELVTRRLDALGRTGVTDIGAQAFGETSEDPGEVGTSEFGNSS
ncbi:MAG: hypothetical protein KDB24_00140 [Microthrixaceae bacterium]|nr:hypothetical protein [Microthrixaceae bacterium]